MQAIDVALATIHIIGEAQTNAVVEPFTYIDVSTKTGLAPLDVSIVTGRILVRTFPPVNVTISGDKPVFPSLGRQITNRIHMTCSHHGAGNCK